jgi:hypothetical protein
MKAKIFRLPGNSVLIEKYEGDKLIRRRGWPAMLYAGFEIKKDEEMVNVSSVLLHDFDAFSLAPADIEIDGVPQTDAQAAVEELNGFIGNYSHGSGISVDAIKDALQDAIQDAIPDELNVIEI